MGPPGRPSETQRVEKGIVPGNKLISREISLQTFSQFFKASKKSGFSEQQQNYKVSSKPDEREGKNPNLIPILPTRFLANLIV